jgi:[ribosomal protein S18]-alanine N-acetyltransferase
MIEIVEGCATDVAAIMPVMEAAFDPMFGEAWTAAQCLSTLAMPGTRLIMAQQKARVAGFALSRWVMDEEELLLIAVDPDCRRQGVGKSLIDELSKNAKSAQRLSIFLEVRKGNLAQYFYEDMGFFPVGIRPDYYTGIDGSRHDSITMQKNVQ